MHRLLKEALTARSRAVAPLTHFTVGCALETIDGTIIHGANIESVIPALSLCAERSAIAAALSQGHRQFKRIAVMADYPSPIPPCGVCRQMILEFAPDAEIVMGNTQGQERSVPSVRAFLPEAYEATFLNPRR